MLVEGMTPPPGLQFVTRSGFVGKEAAADVLGILAEVGGAEGSPIMAVRSVGGAVARVPADATAYAHRQADLMFTTTMAGPPPVIEAGRPGFAALWERLAPHVSGAYANFLSSAGADDVAAVYPAGTYERLARVKRDHDPGNLFAGNHNIRPA
jgi:hypothetical protein